MTASKNRDRNSQDIFELETFRYLPEHSIESYAEFRVRPQILDKARIETLDDFEIPLHSKQKNLEWLDLVAKEMSPSQAELSKCRLEKPEIRENDDELLDGKNLAMSNRQIESLDLHVYETMTLRNIYQNDHMIGFENPGYECMSDSPKNFENISEIECLSDQTYEFIQTPKRSFHSFQTRDSDHEEKLEDGNSNKKPCERSEGVATLNWKYRCKSKIILSTSYDDYMPQEESFVNPSTDLSCTRIATPLMNYNHCPSTEDHFYEDPKAENSSTVEIYDSVVENNDAFSETIDKISQTLLTDESLGFLQKLRYAKAACPFGDYITFVIYLLCKEVSGYIFLDLYYMVIGASVLVFGGRDYYNCQLSNHLSFLVIVFGTLAVLAGITKLSLMFLNSPEKLFSCLSLLSTTLRVFMLLFSVAGFYEVVIYYPPNEQDSSSANYCSPLIYWSAMYAFVLNVLLYFIIFVHGILIILWYFL